MSINDYEIEIFCYPDSSLNDVGLILHDYTPEFVFRRQKITDRFNDIIKHHLSKYKNRVHLMILWKNDILIKTCASSLDDEYDLKSLINFWRL